MDGNVNVPGASAAELAKLRKAMMPAFGHGEPTGSTPGVLWQDYFDEDTGTAYTCVAVSGTGETTWKKTMNAVSKHADRHGKDSEDPITPESIGAVSAAALQSHIDDQNNPHNVTAGQVEVAEAVVNAMKKTGNWSVDGALTMLFSMLNGSSGTTLYQWKRTRNELKTYSNTMPSWRTLKFRASNSVATVYYSSECGMDEDGNPYLVNPKTLSIPYSATSFSSYLATLNGKFVDTDLGGTTYMNKVTSSTTITTEENDSGTKYVVFSNMPYCEWQEVSDVVTSEDPNAHYNGEVDADGYKYTTLSSLDTGTVIPHIASGTYAGGTSGLAIIKPTDFKPKLIFIFGTTGENDGDVGFVVGALEAGIGYGFGGTTGNYIHGGIRLDNTETTVKLSYLKGYLKFGSSSFTTESNSTYAMNMYNKGGLDYTYFFVG